MLTHAFFREEPADLVRSPLPTDGGGPSPQHPLLHLPQPMLLLAAGRQLLLCNPAAAQLPLDCSAGRLMRLGSLNATALETLLRLALAGSPSQTALWLAPQPQTAALSVQRLAAPLRRGWAMPEDCLLLSLQLDQPALTQQARLQLLSQQARLSPAEHSLLLLLADGLTPEAAAEQLGVCLSTVRSHVRHLLAKTRSRSLLELLRWLGSAASQLP
jgi:DNA-binding CsgD family transcriptional regulator